jgi:hypothetical protein
MYDIYLNRLYVVVCRRGKLQPGEGGGKEEGRRE